MVSNGQRLWGTARWHGSWPLSVRRSEGGMLSPCGASCRLAWTIPTKNDSRRGGSLSETKLRGMLWILPTMSMNILAMPEAEYCVGNMPKWTPFEKRSIATRMVEWPWKFGSPTIKSRERSSHGRVGIGKGHNNPRERRWSYFDCWHEMQLATYWQTSFFIFAQVKFSRTRVNVFMTPMCPAVGVEWNSARIVEMDGAPCSSQMCPFCKIKSCQKRQLEWLWGSSKIF